MINNEKRNKLVNKKFLFVRRQFLKKINLESKIEVYFSKANYVF